MNKKIYIIINYILYFINLAVAIAMVYLNRYAYGRGGLYKHLYFKRYHWEMDILSSSTVILHGFILLVFIVISLCMFLKTKNSLVKSNMILAVLNLYLAGFLRFGPKKVKDEVLLYPYAILIFSVSALIYLLFSISFLRERTEDKR